MQGVRDRGGLEARAGVHQGQSLIEKTRKGEDGKRSRKRKQREKETGGKKGKGEKENYETGGQDTPKKQTRRNRQE